MALATRRTHSSPSGSQQRHTSKPRNAQLKRAILSPTLSQDVGHYCDGRDGYGFDNPGSETYLSLNGLNVGDDAVLGDYIVWGKASEGTIWSITARSGGELLWIAGGVIGELESETDRYTATVSSYAESDCTIDAYGESGLVKFKRRVAPFMPVLLDACSYSRQFQPYATSGHAQPSLTY